MEKHEDNLDKLLKAELEKEAGEIMEEMDSDESLQDISFPEDLDEKMWSKIQEYEEQQKAYEKLSDADKEAIRLGREVQALRGGENTKDHLKKDVESDSYIDNVVPIEHVKHETDNKASDDGTNGETEKEAGKKKVKKRKRHWKVYGIVAIVAVLAMMWSMVSIGGTPFFGRVLNDIIGDREMVKVNTEREDGDKNKVDDYDEFQVYEEIKEKLGVDVVRLKRTSKDMLLVQSDIDESLKRVCLIYENEDGIIQYQMEIQVENKSYGYDIEDEKIKEFQIEVGGHTIDVSQYQLPNGGKENVAKFVYKDVFYTLNGIMDEEKFKELYGEEGDELASKLEGTLRAIPLTSMPALSTAFINDVDPTLTFAQMLYGYGNKGDVFLGISTSGNSKNIIKALQVAKVKGIKTIGLTGASGGKMKEYCDVTIKVPEIETFKIQEFHLPIYHCLCAMLEADFFNEK